MSQGSDRNLEREGCYEVNRTVPRRAVHRQRTLQSCSTVSPTVQISPNRSTATANPLSTAVD